MLYKKIVATPILGDIVRILNSYAYNGDYRSDNEFASLSLWIKCYATSIIISMAAALLCMPDLLNNFVPFNLRLTYSVEANPGALSISILPNLLGFGIGVYALVFGLRSRFLQLLHDHYNKQLADKPGSALLLNSNFAVPLLSLTLATTIGICQTLFPQNKTLEFTCWWALWISLIFIFETIATLFSLGEAHIVTESSPETKKNSTLTRKTRINRRLK